MRNIRFPAKKKSGAISAVKSPAISAAKTCDFRCEIRLEMGPNPHLISQLFSQLRPHMSHPFYTHKDLPPCPKNKNKNILKPTLITLKPQTLHRTVPNQRPLQNLFSACGPHKESLTYVTWNFQCWERLYKVHREKKIFILKKRH